MEQNKTKDSKRTNKPIPVREMSKNIDNDRDTQRKIEYRFLEHMSLLLQHQALMIDSMTRLISKYEMVIENYQSVLCTLKRIEDKIDNIQVEDEGI